MAVSIAEVIVEKLPWTTLNLANKFVAVFKRDWRDGYSRKFQKLLEEVKNGDELLDKIRPDSDKSGGAMRAGPCGIFKDETEVVQRAMIQASITHNTADGMSAAAASALMVHYFLYEKGPREKLGEYLNHLVPPRDWNEPWVGKVKAQGWVSVRAAITAIQTHDSLSDILRACIAFSGDVDTVGAIAMGAASCAKDIKQDLPDVLKYNLEHSKYGLQFLEELDAKLLAMKGTV
jgi:ADP-ribosylglycohydrolase